MLYLIGIGLADEKDISIKGLEAVKKCDKVYLENYTSKLQCSHEDLERFYLKKIIPADRERCEQGMDQIIKEAKEQDIAFLVIGDPFSATTHAEIFKTAIRMGVEVKVINNASVLNAVGIVGLELYKYGKVTSIPYDMPSLETPYNVLKENGDLHTLFLLDLKPPRYMTVKEGLEILERIERWKKEKVLSEDSLIIGCARLGSDNFVIKAGKIKEVKEFDFGEPPHCLIIPGKMHFIEKEMLELWSQTSA